jgi:hypothetical protein
MDLKRAFAVPTKYDRSVTGLLIIGLETLEKPETPHI